ncbi:MAG: lysophospholipid acyltransferase family protein [Chlorobium sp.]|nr:MAG: lysophospholipid acyltransferase family protein [Chlorobium sp.]
MKRNWEDDDQITERVYYGLIMVLGFLVRSISRKRSTAVAHLVGDFVFKILKTRRKLVEENLAITFPEKNSSEIIAIARRVYRNQAENIIEMLRLPMIKTAEDAERLLDFDSKAILAKTIDQKKGGVMVSAHFGNWELLALCAGLLMAPVTIVVKPVKNHAIDRQINAWRTMRGNRIVYDWQALREGLKALQEGRIVSLLGDQSNPAAGFFTDFLGRRTSVFLGPAFLALKAGVPLIVVMCCRASDGRYTVNIEEIEMTDLGTAKADVEELARRYTKVIERFIYRYPEEWFWLHNRWKRSEL